MKTLGDRAAFPITESHTQEGMSLRAWLAGQALAGIIANYGNIEDAEDARYPACQAVLVADATLKELAKEGR